MALPADVTSVLDRFAATLLKSRVLTALYAGGSIASGDFRPAVSDLDLVAVVEAPLDEAQQAWLKSLHQALADDEPASAKLHCVYVPLPDMADPAVEHLTWAHGELYGRPFGGVARAEVLAFGLTLFGPPPDVLVPPLPRAALEAAVRADLAGYWTDAVAKPHLWLQDVYVDLGLLILARAEVTLVEGRLITKSEALPRLASFGVDPALVDEIGRRRAGCPVTLSAAARKRRAEHARYVMDRGIKALLG